MKILRKRSASSLFLLFILSSALVSLSEIGRVRASGTIYIRADGSVEGTDKIQRDGNIYTFTDNIFNQSIVVQRDNIVIDGSGYILQGIGNGIGIDLSERNNTTIRNMEINRFFIGIWLDMSSENSISGNNITNNEVGIDLNQSSNNSIYGNDMMNNWRGTSFWHSSNNSMYGNNITNNDDGIWIGQSSNFNSISENNVTNNDEGIWLDNSSNNTLRGNSMTNNGYNFGVWGESLSDFVNDVDASNTVDGEPVYYWIGMRDVTVPLDAGHVALINCINITVQDLNLIKNRQGALLAYTTNSTITRNNLASNWHGVRLWYSSNNNISGNTITNNQVGIPLINSSRNNVTGNNIATNNDEGIYIRGSLNNTVAGNTITNNWRGISLEYSSNTNIYKNNITANNFDGIILWCSADNKFYDNNFIDNTHQVYIPIPGYANFWNNGYPSGGNYWSDYEERYPNATKIDGSGIWDTPYVIDEDNQDNYPLLHRYGCIRNLDTNLSYLTIQSAIGAPETLDGHTIFVEEGTYYEHVFINKSISLIGENTSTTVIDGNGTGNVVTITTGNVSISGFTIQHGGFDQSCIYLSSSSGVTINDNAISNNFEGIRLNSSNGNDIADNLISPYAAVGIFLEYSNGNVIRGNIINPEIGLDQIGILLTYSTENSIINNTILNNVYDGIKLIWDANANVICGNKIKDNGYGVLMVDSGNNTLYHNNFINNGVSCDYANTWDNGYPSGGNYWSDYESRHPNATEIDDSGIWDTPYVIDGNNQDNYPIIPEFPTWTSMLLILIVLTVATAIYRRRLLKTPIH